MHNKMNNFAIELCRFFDLKPALIIYPEFFVGKINVLAESTTSLDKVVVVVCGCRKRSCSIRVFIAVNFQYSTIEVEIG